jgi:hypothetical protein
MKTIKKPKLIEALEQFEKGPAVLFYIRRSDDKCPKTITCGGKRHRVIGLRPKANLRATADPDPLVVPDKIYSNVGEFANYVQTYRLTCFGKAFLEKYRSTL